MNTQGMRQCWYLTVNLFFMKITAKGHIKNGKLVINKSELPVFLHIISIQKNKPVNVIVEAICSRIFEYRNTITERKINAKFINL